MGVGYRLRQLRDNLTARPLSEEAKHELAEYLSPPEQQLFESFSAADQRHSYRVFRTLRASGYNHPDLLVAALLHDIGKTKYGLSAWDRTVIVVGQTFAPHRVEAWGSGPPEGMRRPFVVRLKHPEWGADMARSAGSRPAVVELIRRHQDRLTEPVDEADWLLLRLQQADDQS